MERLELARKLILEAGQRLRRVRLSEQDALQKSSHRDLVTQYDRETEQFLRSHIQEVFPGDAIVGEEFPPSCAEAAPVVWYIDPIDGTTNFISEHRNFAISVGCYESGVPGFGLVLDVMANVLYWARAGEGAYRGEEPIHTAVFRRVEDMLLTTPGILASFLRPHPYRDSLVRLAQDLRGVRSLGSVALELCAVAAGEADLFVTLRSAPWDHNAARLILTEAGGYLCTVEGKPVPDNCTTTILAGSSAETVEKVLEGYLAGAYDRCV